VDRTLLGASGDGSNTRGHGADEVLLAHEIPSLCGAHAAAAVVLKTVLWDRSTVRARFRRSSPLNATVPTKIPGPAGARVLAAAPISCPQR
jgi:hypothetical protein